MKTLIFATVLVLVFAVNGVQAGSDSTRGKELAQECGFCHGVDGKGDDEVPGITGLEETDFIGQLKALKSGERVTENEMMLMYIEDLSDQDMADLAAYFSTLESD